MSGASDESLVLAPHASRPARPLLRRLGPLLFALLLLALLLLALKRAPQPDAQQPSALLGRPAPALDLPRLSGTTSQPVPKTAGQVWLLNVWASWCEPCRAEHGLLQQLQREGVLLVGLDYKDPDGASWLAERGNPFSLALADASGRAALDWGVYGVPETFVIDRRGLVRWRHAGPLSATLIEQELRPLLQALQREASP